MVGLVWQQDLAAKSDQDLTKPDQVLAARPDLATFSGQILARTWPEMARNGHFWSFLGPWRAPKETQW